MNTIGPNLYSYKSSHEFVNTQQTTQSVPPLNRKKNVSNINRLPITWKY